eukprot:c16989_g1_i2.p2 GENE.c16989_g1_i2~~c16989_g1_i2.p2  ORF type:complete len:174 (-),score=32.61 c16989_g1_i2:26-547(-)
MDSMAGDGCGDDDGDFREILLQDPRTKLSEPWSVPFFSILFVLFFSLLLGQSFPRLRFPLLVVPPAPSDAGVDGVGGACCCLDLAGVAFFSSPFSEDFLLRLRLEHQTTKNSKGAKQGRGVRGMRCLAVVLVQCVVLCIWLTSLVSIVRLISFVFLDTTFVANTKQASIRPGM